MCFILNKAADLFLKWIVSEVYQNKFVKNNKYNLMKQNEEGITYFHIAMIFWALKFF